MKALLLAVDEQKVSLDSLYESIAENLETDIFRIGRKDSKNLRGLLSQIDHEKYDRVILFLRFRDLRKQRRVLSRIRNLTIVEHDACQNYIMNSDYHGEFTRFYKSLPQARVITSGFQVTQKLHAEGVNARFVPKGFDSNLIRNTYQARDIEVGFIGSLESSVYAGRKNFLESLGKSESLTLLKTNSPEKYNKEINRIRFFLSCDIGLGEYMIKNFEAMGAGCCLFAYDQGADENKALGFKTLENIVLYNSIQSLRDQLENLRSDSRLAERIARNGEKLAFKNFSFDAIGEKIAREVKTPFI